MKAGTTSNLDLTHRQDWIGPLDGIRALAALWVLVGHVMQRTGFLVPMLSEPATAVEIFMVMSGFLMTFHAVKREPFESMDLPRSWLIFWCRRFFRIAPLYYLLLMCAIFLTPWLRHCQVTIASAAHVAAIPVAWPSGASILLHLSFLFGLTPKYAVSMPLPDWSISLEMQFYAVFPFLMLMYRRLGVPSATAILTVIWLLGHGLIRLALKKMHIEYTPLALAAMLPVSLIRFIVGMVMGFAFCSVRIGGSRLFLTLLTILLSLLTGSGPFVPLVVLICTLLLSDFTSEQSSKLTVIGVSRRVLASPVATLFADLSYSVYLVHPIIMILLTAWLTRYHSFLHGKPSTKFALLVTLTVVAASLIALVTRQVVERPGIRFGKFFIRKIFGETAKAVSTELPHLSKAERYIGHL